MKQNIIEKKFNALVPEAKIEPNIFLCILEKISRKSIILENRI